MAKRKIETEEQKLPARDQPRKAKKHKKNHEAFPVVDNFVTDRPATSTAHESTESAGAEGDDIVYSREITERFEELKRAVMEEVQKQKQKEASGGNGQMIEEHILQESAPISQTKKKRKHKHKEDSRGENGGGKEDDQAQGNLVVGKTAPRSTEGQEKRKHKHRDKDSQRQKRRLRQDDIKDVLGRKKGQSAWRVSEPIAGHLGDLDPVFSHDEK